MESAQYTLTLLAEFKSPAATGGKASAEGGPVFDARPPEETEPPGLSPRKPMEATVRPCPGSMPAHWSLEQEPPRQANG